MVQKLVDNMFRRVGMTNLLIRLFVKDSQNTSNELVRGRYGKFSGIVGIMTNLLLFLIKIIAGTLSNSIAIVADAVNNLFDSVSSIITLISFKVSEKPADAKHPYGHARMEYVSSLIISFIILIFGIQFIKSSVEKIIHPDKVVFSWLAISILIVSILIKLWQSLFYRKISRVINSSTIYATSIDSRNDMLATSSLLLASIISTLTAFNLDGYMGVAVAVFIIISGIKMVADTISPLLGLAPSEELVRSIYKKVLSYDGIVGLHDLTVHNYGVSKRFASVHCEVSAKQDIMVSHDLIDNIERDFLKDMGIYMVIHLDPVIMDDEQTNELKEAVEKLIKEISDDIHMHDFRVVWGITHSNLIFDVVVPYKFRLSDEELSILISERILELNPTYRSVITVDHSYIPDFSGDS